LRVARALLDLGREAIVITGGLRAWQKNGLPMERVPASDIVQLPRF
jgi:rhodanese-related sulfurtransferase